MAKISLFDNENSFWSFLTRIYNLAYAGFLWFVTSLPLITIGASTTALYSYVFAVTEQRDGYVGRTFFASFRKNFGKATCIWVGMVVIFGFLFFDGYLASTGDSIVSRILFFVVISVGIIFAILSVHIFPFLSKWDIPYKEMAKSIFLVGIGALPVSITLVIVNLLFFLLIYAFYPVALFAQGFVAALCSLFLRSSYNRLENLNDI
ncbi:MAG: DUF624 domain-containing protein [Sphaerochaeta sp.]